jgi:hypothetical protein
VRGIFEMKWIVLLLLLPLSMKIFSQRDSIRSKQTNTNEDSLMIKVTRMPFNSVYSDFSPYVMGREIYFVSDRPNETAVEYKDSRGNPLITDLYHVRMKERSKTGKPLPLPKGINTKFHEGPLCFGQHGNLIIYSSNEKGSELQKLYYAEKVDGKWATPRKFSFCLDSFQYCHPALNESGDTLWFSSNSRGGSGGMDIYFSHKENEGWTEPVNAGPAINTHSNEVFPFFSDQGLLYFSSDRAGGMGGLDLYRVSTRRIDSVRALGPPFNSTADDFSIYIDSTLDEGYFSSNRQPKTKDDIYYFAKTMPDADGAKIFKGKNKFCYTFFEENTETLQDSMTFEFEWNFGDGAKAKGIKTRHCYSQPGNYFVQLNMVQKVSGEVFESQTSYSLNIDTVPLFSIVSKDTVEPGEKIIFDYRIEGVKGFRSNKAYWSFGDGKYNTGRSLEHIFRKSGDYIVKVILEGTIDKRTQKLLSEKTIKVIKKP